MTSIRLWLAAALTCAILTIVWVAGPWLAARATANATYVGADRCSGCHAVEAAAWQHSHHAKSMAKSDSGTVLGNFDHATFEEAGVHTTFGRTADRFVVDTDNAAGQPERFPALYTFGVFPLQQYLLPGPNGALQALNIAWDARPAEQGGQRWFHLHAGENVGHDSVLHWTAPSQNWNFMCADCHSTHLEKNFDPATRHFNTTWSDMNVACEACHGPGSAHARWAGWASLPLIGHLAGSDPQLQFPLNERRAPNRMARVLNPSLPLNFTPGPEVQACAPCHSRRSQVTNAYVPREGYAGSYKPELLSEPLYYVDGQMREEVYEYGSFQQSRMFARGVTCSDCHDPHTAELRATGNALCLQCHERTFDSPAHHFHEPNSSGSQCVNCHMPTHTYMTVDARRDHSIRVPRPDLSVKLGTPNACNACHSDKSAEWAASWVTQRYGAERRGLQQFADQLDSIRRQSPGAELAIRELVADRNVPDLVKATALSEAGPYLQNDLSETLRVGLTHANATVRLGALQALDEAPPETRWDLAAPLLDDRERTVRIEAARILGSAATLTAEQRRSLETPWSEFVAAVRVNADRAEWHSVYAAALAARGDSGNAVQELRTALELNPGFAGGYVNLADAYRQSGRDDLSEATLEQGLKIDNRNAALHAALGLRRVRQHRVTEAIGELSQAVSFDPDNGSYGYLYASALQSQNPSSARRFLQTAVAGRHDRSELYLLIQLLADQGDQAALAAYLPQLRELARSDLQASSLLEDVQSR